VSEGYVYILSNEAMPGYVKIGFTRQNDVQSRMRQLHTTGVPLPFECIYFARVPDCRKVERALHFVFADDRAATSREFFRIDPDRARAIIELVAIQVATLSDDEQQISPEQRVAIEAVKSRAEAMTFTRLGLPVGTVLRVHQGSGGDLHRRGRARGRVPRRRDAAVGGGPDRGEGAGVQLVHCPRCRLLGG